MTDTTEAQASAQVQEPTPEQMVKHKPKHTGNLIFDASTEIENLTKTKALNLAAKLSEDIEANYFRLGGLLKLIQQQQWYEGFPSFYVFVQEKFGFAKRKADYLISIYTNLVDKQIPWEKVAHLGWTKLKDLAMILTNENLDEWIAKADAVTVIELQALIKAAQGGTGEGASSEKTTTSITTLKFKLHQDQADAVQSALAKAKGELQTEFDNVALAAICTGYLSNASGVVGGPADMKAEFQKMGFEGVLGLFEQVFPNVDLEVTVK